MRQRLHRMGERGYEGWMEDDRVTFFGKVYRGWKARLLTGAPIGAAVYQFLCDQLGAPTIKTVFGMTPVPWWGWLLLAQIGALYGLFEYLRHNVPDHPKQNVGYSEEIASLRRDLAAIPQLQARLEELKRQVAALGEAAEQPQQSEALRKIEGRLTSIEGFLSPLKTEQRKQIANMMAAKIRTKKAPLPVDGKIGDYDLGHHHSIHHASNLRDAGVDLRQREIAQEKAKEDILKNVKYCVIQESEADIWPTPETKQAWHLFNAYWETDLELLRKTGLLDGK